MRRGFGKNRLHRVHAVPYLYPILPDSGALAVHIALINGFGNGKFPSLRAKFSSNFSLTAS
jgi:hypothetical protein